MGSRETLEVMQYRRDRLQERIERGEWHPDVSDEALRKMHADLEDYDRHIRDFRLDDDDDDGDWD